MQLISTHDLHKERRTEFFTTHWGSPQMVISSGVYQCDELDGFAVLDEADSIKGMITFVLHEDHCEIISLDSTEENKGIGTELIKKVESHARNNHCPLIQLVTTNDNLRAISFYQKRGYRIQAIHRCAVDQARKIKPEIPEVADNGIAIRDELLLGKVIEP